MLLAALKSHAANRPNAPAITSHAASLTWHELASHVSRMAAFLTQHNVRRLAIVLENSIPWVIMDLACLQAGVVCVPLPPGISEEQQRILLNQCSVDARLSTIALEQWETVPCSLGVFQVRRVVAPASLPHDTAKIISPPGASVATSGLFLREKGMWYAAKTLEHQVSHLGLRRHLVVLPLSMVPESLMGLWLPLLQGTEMVLLPADTVGFGPDGQFDTARFMTVLASWKPDSLTVTPALLPALTAIARAHSPVVAPLRFIMVGADRIPAALLAEARACGLPVNGRYSNGMPESLTLLNLPLGAADENALVAELETVTAAPTALLSTSVPGAAMDQALLSPCLASGQPRVYGRDLFVEWVELEAMLCPSIIRMVVCNGDQTAPVALIHCLPGDEHHVRAQLQDLRTRLPDYPLFSHLIFTREISQTPYVSASGHPRREALWQRFYQQIIHVSGGDSACQT